MSVFVAALVRPETVLLTAPAVPFAVLATPPAIVVTVPVAAGPSVVEPVPEVLAVRVPPPASCNASRNEMSFTSALSAAVLAAGAFFGTKLKSEARSDAPSFVIFSGAGTG